MASTTEMLAPLDGSSLYKEAAKTAGNSVLGKDEFLNLLVAQMKYQNPLEPMSNTESIAQLAQFSALEQMTNIAQGQQEGSAYSLIGKYVIGNLYNESTGLSETIYGTVSSVKKSGNEMYLIIDGQELPLSNVSHVTDTNYNALGAINNNIATNQSLTLIGKNIQAILTDADGNITKFVEGKVDYVKVSNGRTILMVNDVEVFAEEVLLVSDGPKLIDTKPVTAVTYDDNKEEVRTTGKIKRIEFVDNKPYLVIAGENGDKKIAVDTISDVTEAINLLGKNVDTKDVRGKVEEIVIKSGAVYLMVDGQQVKLETVRKALTEGTYYEPAADTAGETTDENGTVDETSETDE